MPNIHEMPRVPIILGLNGLSQAEMPLLQLNTDLFCISDSLQESLFLCLMQRIWQLVAHYQNTALKHSSCHDFHTSDCVDKIKSSVIKGIK